MVRVKLISNGPRALVLSPTRELAIQIHQEVQKYSYRGIRRYEHHVNIFHKMFSL
jgi:superfamily II DNA/RNA helicase